MVVQVGRFVPATIYVILSVAPFPPGFLTNPSTCLPHWQAVRSVNKTIPIWAGEIGPHNGGGSPTPSGDQLRAPNAPAPQVRVLGKLCTLLSLRSDSAVQ